MRLAAKAPGKKTATGWTGGPHREKTNGIEVVANRLPIWGGAQVAVNATLFCPVRANGTTRPGAAATEGVALREAERTKSRDKYPELL